MKSSRALVVALALVALLLPAGAVRATEGGLEKGQFRGTDGVVYDASALTVDGSDGHRYYGPEFDVACGFGVRMRSSMKAMTALAKAIERSGRRVVWAGAPGKASVVPEFVATLPHGSCDRAGLKIQSRLVDTYRDPNYLPLRKALVADRRQVYYKTDPHWTPVGGSVFSKALATRLDPALGKRQRYTYDTHTSVGLLNEYISDPTPETVRTAKPAVNVRVRTTRSSAEDYDAFPGVVLDHSWRSRPAKRTWPGRTLLLGDSFTSVALETLRPIFSRGRFMWVVHADLDEVVAEIKASDTVVIEVFQTFLPLDQGVTETSFLRKVRRALR